MIARNDPLAAMRAWIDAVNRRDRARCQGAWHGDATWSNRASGLTWNGPEEITAQLWNWLDACPDLHISITDAFSNDSRGLVEVAWRGTHSREIASRGGTIAPTGRRLAWNTGYLVGTRDGRITSITDYYDALSLLPYPSSFPELASVEVRGDRLSPPFARSQLRRGYFPELATIHLTISFPQLACIAWEGGNSDSDTSLAPVPAPGTFPDLAGCRW